MNIKNNKNIYLTVGDFITWDNTAIRMSWTRKTINNTLSVHDFILEANFPDYKAASAYMSTTEDIPPCYLIEYKMDAKNMFYSSLNSDSLELELFEKAIAFGKDMDIVKYLGNKRFAKFLKEDIAIKEEYILVKHANYEKAVLFLNSIQGVAFMDMIRITSEYIDDGGSVFILPKTIERVLVFDKNLIYES